MTTTNKTNVNDVNSYEILGLIKNIESRIPYLYNTLNELDGPIYKSIETSKDFTREQKLRLKQKLIKIINIFDNKK